MEGLVDKIENLAFLMAHESESISECAHSFEEVLERYSTSNSEMREEIRQKISLSTRKNLLVASEKLAIEALIEKRVELLSFAMVCHAIEDFKWDSRENILRMAIVWHVCKKLKLDIKEVFKKSMEIASNEAVGHFTEFLNRDEYMKSPRAMGFEIKTKGKKIVISEITPFWAK